MLTIFIIILTVTITQNALSENITRTWTALNGQKLEAKFIKTKGALVVLQKEDGSFLNINKAKLIINDRTYLKSITTPKSTGPTEGTLTFEVETKSTGKVFAPRHVMAIWVTDSSGKFIKTLECNAKHFAKHLKKWKKSSDKNIIDAVTSASLKTHKKHKVSWDGTDASGKTVRDGIYQIHIEFTEENGSGLYTPKDYIKFKKGSELFFLKPKPLPHFKKMALTYTPSSN